VDAGRGRGKAAARGKVKAVIVALEAAVNEARNQCKKKNI
jgi:tRNA(Met) C34 N-acetyltransferase TmcA